MNDIGFPSMLVAGYAEVGGRNDNQDTERPSRISRNVLRHLIRDFNFSLHQLIVVQSYLTNWKAGKVAILGDRMSFRKYNVPASPEEDKKRIGRKQKSKKLIS